MDLVSNDSTASPPLLQVLAGLLDGSWTAASDASLVDLLTQEENQALDAILAVVVKKNYLARFVECHYQIAIDNPQAAKALPTMSLVCHNCSAVVNLPPPDSHWYCVARGLRIGFVRGWENVKRLVLHVPENKYTSHTGRDAACKAFVLSVASKEAFVINMDEHAVAYDPVPEGDGFLYP